MWNAENRPPLIVVGLDPGTTAGLAALGLDGSVLAVESKRGWGQNKIIDQILKIGRVVVIGGDKLSTPSTLERIAAKCGARLVIPHRDLSIQEKRRLCKGSSDYWANAHEFDALASAFCAMKGIKGIMSKIEKTLIKMGQEDRAYEVGKLVLTSQNLTPMQAIKSLDAMIDPDTKPNMNPFPSRAYTQRRSPPPLHVRLANDNKLLTGYIGKLQETITRQKKDIQRLRQTKKRSIQGLAARKLSGKNQRIRALERRLKEEKTNNQKLLRSVSDRNQALASGKKILRCLPDLSRKEWQKMRPPITKEDYILVENLNIFSPLVLKELFSRCENILYTQPPKGVRRRLSSIGFNLYDCSGLKIQKIGDFILIDPESFKCLQAARIECNEIIREYRSTQKNAK